MGLFSETCSKCGKKVSLWKVLSIDSKSYCSNECAEFGRKEMKEKEEQRERAENTDNGVIQIDLIKPIPYNIKKIRKDIGFPILASLRSLFKESQIAYIPNDIKKRDKLIGIDIFCFQPIRRDSVPLLIQLIQRVFEENKLDYKILNINKILTTSEELQKEAEENMKKGEVRSIGLIGSEEKYYLVEKKGKRK